MPHGRVHPGAEDDRGSNPSEGNTPVEIRAVEGQTGPGKINPTSVQKSKADPAAAAQPGQADQVQISPAARYLEQYNRLPPVRADKVAAARQAVSDGTADTDAKLSVAIDRLLDDLLGE